MACVGRYRLARRCQRAERARSALAGERPGDDRLDDLALGVGVVLDVGPARGRPARAWSPRSGRARRRASGASRGRRASARSRTSRRLKTCRLTSVSGPLNSAVLEPVGLADAHDVASRLPSAGRRRLVGRVGDAEHDVDDRLGRRARERTSSRRARAAAPVRPAARGSVPPRARRGPATPDRSRRGRSGRRRAAARRS